MIIDDMYIIFKFFLEVAENFLDPRVAWFICQWFQMIYKIMIYYFITTQIKNIVKKRSWVAIMQDRPYS